jgi:hypothetical protein
MMVGKQRDKKLKLRFRLGQSIMEMASFFQRMPDFILGEAKPILGSPETAEQRLNREESGPMIRYMT